MITATCKRERVSELGFAERDPALQKNLSRLSYVAQLAIPAGMT